MGLSIFGEVKAMTRFELFRSALNVFVSGPHPLDPLLRPEKGKGQVSPPSPRVGVATSMGATGWVREGGHRGVRSLLALVLSVASVVFASSVAAQDLQISGKIAFCHG